MNLAKFEGEFYSPQDLIKNTIKTHFEFDFKLKEETMRALQYENFTIEITQTKTAILIKVKGSQLEWTLEELLLVNEFPLTVEKGQLVSVINKDYLSLKLGELKKLLEGLPKDEQEPQSKQRYLPPVMENEPPRRVIPEQVPPRDPAEDLHRPVMVEQRPTHPFAVGEADLNPFGAPGLIPGRHQGMNPAGGMIVGPDHPMFAQPLSRTPFPSGPPQFSPMAAPPGVRFDPVMPFGPGSTPLQPGQSRSQRGRMPFSGDPDFDEFLPPGNNDFM